MTERKDQRLERWLVTLIALHSLGVGVCLAGFPRWSAALGGWPEPSPLFFIRQAGVFHLVVAAGYLLEYHRYRGITLVVLAKSIAVVFLLTMTLTSNAPWAVPASAAGDAAMAATLLLLHRKTRDRKTRDRHQF